MELICVTSGFCRPLVLEKCREFPNWQKTLKRYVSHLASHGLDMKEREGRRREEMEEEGGGRVC